MSKHFEEDLVEVQVSDLADHVIMDAERYNKIKQMTFPEFKAIVQERMDGSGKSLDELIDQWEHPGVL